LTVHGAAPRPTRTPPNRRSGELDRVLEKEYTEAQFDTWARITMAWAVRYLKRNKQRQKARTEPVDPILALLGETPPQDVPEARSRFRWVVAAVLLGLLATAVHVVRDLARPETTLPNALAGRWATAAAGYDGRVLEIKTDSVIFHLGDEAGGRAEGHRIQRVERASGDLGMLYTVTYLTVDDAELTLALYYSAEPPTLRLKNQRDMEWRRERS
jgi:hypothetical protein